VHRASVVALTVLLPMSSMAQVLDRSIVPTPGKPATLHVPPWTKSTLANGAELIVVEKRDLPLVAVNIDFIGGSANYESADKLGTADVVAEMLSEGTPTRTAEQLSDAQQLLGTSIEASISGENGTIRFSALRTSFEPALALAADMMLNSTYPDSALARIRARTLVRLTQAKDEPDAIAENVFTTITYGNQHPYGRVVREKNVKAITRADVISFAKAYFRPGHALITVSGDVDAKTAKRAVEMAFASWSRGGERPAFSYPALPPARPRTIYLVDKPHATQSVFAFGIPGPSRHTPDYYALQVMNMLLGGLFQSRLNRDIREAKGFSYVVGSNFDYGRGPGPFKAGGDIVSAKSDSALIAFMADFQGVQGSSPFTDDEVTQGKQALIQSLPGRFSTVNRIAASISSIYLQDLSETYFRDFAQNIEAVTKEDLTRVAKQYIDLEHLNLVIVGDRALIEGPLKATGIAPIQLVDVEGHPMVTP
jgi:zinc protease